jgi:ribosomal protein S27E
MVFVQGATRSACVLCRRPPTDGYVDVNLPGVNVMDVICRDCVDKIVACYPGRPSKPPVRMECQKCGRVITNEGAYFNHVRACVGRSED